MSEDLCELANCLIQLLFTHEDRLIIYSFACLHSLLVVSVVRLSAALLQRLLDGSRSVEGSFQFGIFRNLFSRRNPLDRAHTLIIEFFRALYSVLVVLLTSRKVVFSI